jgi:hypothetical protein
MLDAMSGDFFDTSAATSGTTPLQGFVDLDEGY